MMDRPWVEMNTLKKTLPWGLRAKGVRCVGLITLLPSCADCLEPVKLEPYGPVEACNGTDLLSPPPPFGTTAPNGPEPPHSRGYVDHTQRRITIGRTPPDEWSARRRDLTTHNTHYRQTSMLQVGFEPTLSAGERPQTYALDRAATGTGTTSPFLSKI